MGAVMVRNREARLGKLEENVNQRQSLVVIRRTTVDADGSLIPYRFEMTDGRYRWEKGRDESAEAFERRVSHDVDRITNHGTVVLLPANGRDI
jgi:hypothetical protein